MIITPEIRASLRHLDADDAIDRAVEVALEAAAKVCEEQIDTDWPNDEISQQAQACANEIRALKEQK
jgi:predicted ATP-grasp superfamily ATP-dependent carboligase